MKANTKRLEENMCEKDVSESKVLDCFKKSTRDKSSVEYIQAIIGTSKVPDLHNDSMCPMETQVNKPPWDLRFEVEGLWVIKKDRSKKEPTESSIEDKNSNKMIFTEEEHT